MPYSAWTNAMNCTTGKTKQTIHKRMAQHRRATSSGQDSAVHLQLKESGHSFEDRQVCVLEREDHWFEKGVKKAIHVKLKKNIFKPGWWPKTLLSPTYNAVLHSQGQNSKHSHHLTGPDDSPTDKEEGFQQKLGQRLCQRLSGDHPSH